MARSELSNRGKWQGKAGESGGAAEMIFQVVLDTHFENTPYEITTNPKALQDIYNKGTLNKKTGRITGKHGVKIDFEITNTNTNKSIFVEMKRQMAGRGNAHERACKFFMPGLQKIGREKANLNKNQCPFWIVFSNGIARDKNRIEEILYWFDDVGGNVLLWRELKNRKAVIDHFEKHIRQIID
jgi:hypothetical protein